MTKALTRSCLVLALGLPATACVSHQSSASHHEAAQFRVALALQYYQADRLDEAKRQVDLALNAHKDYAPAYTMMGLLLQSEGSTENIRLADSYFRRALSIDPGSMAGHFYYGLYLVQLNQPERAAGHFDKAGSDLAYEGRLAALENLAYIRYQAWQDNPTDTNQALAFYALQRAIRAGSLNRQLQDAMSTISKKDLDSDALNELD